MDIRKVKKLMELLEESGMAEIEIKEGEESVLIIIRLIVIIIVIIIITITIISIELIWN